MTDLEILRGKLRRHAIRKALYAAYPMPLGTGLIRESLPEDVAADGKTVENALYYLRDRGQVELVGAASGTVLNQLTPAGIDRVESDDRYGPERAANVRMLRLRVLAALDLSRDQPMGLRLLSLALASDKDLDISEPSLLRALAYLSHPSVGLASLAGKDAATTARITADGIDYVTGDGQGYPGIALPLGW